MYNSSFFFVVLHKPTLLPSTFKPGWDVSMVSIDVHVQGSLVSMHLRGLRGINSDLVSPDLVPPYLI